MVAVLMRLELLHPACCAWVVRPVMRLVERVSLFVLSCDRVFMVSVRHSVLVSVMMVMVVLVVHTMHPMLPAIVPMDRVVILVRHRWSILWFGSWCSWSCRGRGRCRGRSCRR